MTIAFRPGRRAWSNMLSLNFGAFHEQLAADFSKLVTVELANLQGRLLEHHEVALAAAEVAFDRKLQQIKDSVRSGIPKLSPKPSPLAKDIPREVKEEDWEEEDECPGDEREADALPLLVVLDEHECHAGGIHKTNGGAQSREHQVDANNENKRRVDRSLVLNDVNEHSGDCSPKPLGKSSAVQILDAPPESLDVEEIRHSWSTERQIAFEGLKERAGDRISMREVADLEDWQIPLLMTFFYLDSDDSGILTTDAIRNALVQVGVPQARLQKLVKIADSDCSGDISLEEWLAAVKKCGKDSDMAVLTQRLKTLGSLDALQNDAISPLMLKPNAALRIFCDLLILCSCMYIASVLPPEVAWEDDMSEQASKFFSRCSRYINYFFMFDILLNFRTGYFKPDGDIVMDQKKAALRYLKTWFVFDALTSFPFEDASQVVTNISALKILKLGKLLRVVKLMKLQHIGFGVLQHVVDDVLHSKLGRLLNRRFGIFVQMILVCHWLACGMKVVADTWVDVPGGLWSEYVATLYWAMQTLTTVGYGDMTPQTDGERGYSIFAMVIGGAFYGYVVGALTSLVSSSDLNSSAYWDRMDLIEAWLSYHNLPKEMRKSLRSFFESFLQSNAVLNDAEIWHDLSPEMQRAVGSYLIPENVKNNPLFDGMDTGAVVQMQSILRTLVAPSGSSITEEGEVGTAMYVIDSGILERSYSSGALGRLGAGESFGEEVLLGFFDHYEYTVKVVDKAKLQMILESEFLTVFQKLPRQLQRMRRNALELNPQWEDQLRQTSHYVEQMSSGESRRSRMTISQSISKLRASLSQPQGPNAPQVQSSTSSLLQFAANRQQVPSGLEGIRPQTSQGKSR